MVKKKKIHEANKIFPPSVELENTHLSHLSEQHAEAAQKHSLPLDETFTSNTERELPLNSNDKLQRYQRAKFGPLIGMMKKSQRQHSLSGRLKEFSTPLMLHLSGNKSGTFNKYYQILL